MPAKSSDDTLNHAIVLPLTPSREAELAKNARPLPSFGEHSSYAATPTASADPMAYYRQMFQHQPRSGARSAFVLIGQEEDVFKQSALAKTITQDSNPLNHWIRNQISGSYSTPLSRAKTASEVRALIQQGADLDFRDPNGLTALNRIVSSLEVSHEALQALLEAGADPNIPATHYNETPLHVSAMNGNQDSVEMLIKAGAKLDAIATRDIAHTDKIPAILLLQRKFGPSFAESMIQISEQHGNQSSADNARKILRHYNSHGGARLDTPSVGNFGPGIRRWEIEDALGLPRTPLEDMIVDTEGTDPASASTSVAARPIAVSVATSAAASVAAPNWEPLRAQLSTMKRQSRHKDWQKDIATAYLSSAGLEFRLGILERGLQQMESDSDVQKGSGGPELINSIRSVRDQIALVREADGTTVNPVRFKVLMAALFGRDA